MKVLLTHPGTQYSPMTAYQLYRTGILYRYVTGIAFADEPQSPFWKAANATGLKKLAQRRLVKGLPKEKLYCMPLAEIVALMRMQLRHSSDSIFYTRNRIFQEKIPQRLIDASDAVIGFDTSSWVLAERCKHAGKPLILDASIAHPVSKEKVYETVRSKYPDWSEQIQPKRALNIQVELKEMEMADHIVAATQFTKDTYTENGIPASKISLNPYGTDLDFFEPKTNYRQPGRAAPVSFYFFGTISARKGIPWLADVWKELHSCYPNTKLVAAGFGDVPAGFIFPEGMERIGFVHPADRTQLFHRHDVFVFPSFFEGFAQVIIEAMACGLPVITTTATVGPQIIDEGKEGFVLTPGDDEKLYRAMEYFILNPDKIETMGKAARERVLPLTWDAYGDRWKEIMENVLANPH